MLDLEDHAMIDIQMCVVHAAGISSYIFDLQVVAFRIGKVSPRGRGDCKRSPARASEQRKTQAPSLGCEAHPCLVQPLPPPLSCYERRADIYETFPPSQQTSSPSTRSTGSVRRSKKCRARLCASCKQQIMRLQSVASAGATTTP